MSVKALVGNVNFTPPEPGKLRVIPVPFEDAVPFIIEPVQFFSGNLLLNLDSEDEGEIFIGCAGGIDTLITLPVKYHPLNNSFKSITIQVKGLQGGHSGDDINKARGNAIKIMARFLWNLVQQVEFNLCEIKGGNLRNAIPRESSAIIAFNPSRERDVLSYLEQQLILIRNEFTKEPGLSIKAEAAKPNERCLDSASQQLLSPKCSVLV